MNLDQITTKNFILALFKRDDGERILLGAGLYEFKDGLQHFQPNTIANDIVEKQGTDGQLLAGQVLRSSAQPFDGFIGDATTTRPNIENARRAFIQYFQTNHRYKVIYIMPDGTAIQRQNGYLVDAPSVPEMIQKFPAYHVALAFEDIHYYTYAENPDGSETYAQIFSIDPSGILTGGLVWVANGVEWDGPGMALNAIKGDTFQQSYTGKNLFDGTWRSGQYNSTGEWLANSFDGDRATTDLIPVTGGDYAISLNSDTLYTSFININYFDESENWLGNRITLGMAAFLNTDRTKTFTLPDTAYYLAVSIRPYAGYTGNKAIQNAPSQMLQVERASAVSSYEPFVGGQPSPNPDYPQPIQTVTGTQTITINGQAFPIDLGTTELNDLGNGYQDEIAFDGVEWKLRKATIKAQITADIPWSVGSFSAQKRIYINTSYIFGESIVAPTDNAQIAIALSSHFTAVPLNNILDQTSDGFGISSSSYMSLRVGSATAASDILDILQNNTVKAYAVLRTPTETTITDQALIAQLEAIETALATGGAISITPSGSNLAAIIDAPENGTGGAIWEASGGTSAQPVTNNGIASAQPIWTVDGPAENPSITNETTGQTLTFTGTVPNGQTLTVDCGAQTANIAGVDVKAQITGDWLTIEPGTNLITYSGANVAGPSTIKWNEVIE